MNNTTHLFFRILLVVLSLQSVGVACDDCMLSPVAESCGHSTPDLGDEHSHAPMPAESCVNSLCSLCGHAMGPPEGLSLLARRAATARTLEVQRYTYLPPKGLFRPPRA